MPYGLYERVNNAYQHYFNQQGRERQEQTYYQADESQYPTKANEIFKAVVPNFLYKPPFGFPLGKDVPEIRRLGKVPYVEMVTKTIGNEVASLDPSITTRDGMNVPEDIINQTEDFFYNPNSNEESLEFLLKSYVRDIIELDAGVIEKARSLKDEFVEMKARDGGTFTKNPNLHDILPPPEDGPAYYQYGWLTGARPIPFYRNEIVYTMANPRTESIYGLSAVEVLLDVLQLLTYGIESNLEYFEDNNVPKGIFQMIGADTKAVKAFGESFREQMRTKDPSGKWRKRFHKMPVVNTDGKFERIAFSNLELELIQQQEWFTKIVWATFGITPSELGFTEDSNRATEVIQSNVFKRKAIAPLVSLIEYHFNTQIVNDLPWIKGTKYENNVLFEFDKYDLQEELAKRQIIWGDLKNGYRNANEIRKENDMESVEGGDELRQQGGSNPFGFQTTGGKNGNPEDVNTDKEDAAQGTKNFKSFSFMDTEIEHSESRNNGSQEEKALNTTSPTALEGNERISTGTFKKKITLEFEAQEKIILALLKREGGRDVISELKAIDNEFVNRVVGVIGLSGLKNTVSVVVDHFFYQGLDSVARDVGRNFLPNQAAIDFLKNYTFDLVKGLADETRNDLKQELQRGILNGEGVPDLSKRVQGVMDSSKNRAEMIARTETNRAENMGSLDAWRQSGRAMTKEWLAHIDNRTSGICKRLNGQVVDINERFRDSKTGEKFDGPPALPNCRSTLIFKPVGDSSAVS